MVVGRGNDAIPTWSGFNYQGKMMLLYVLELINQIAKDKNKDSLMEIGYFHSFVQLRRIIMTKRTVTIELASGLEARPIAMLVQLASSYESTIYVQSDNKKINAKSIMGMMTLDLPVGEQVVVTADGVDEEKAVNDIEKYLSTNLILKPEDEVELYQM